ncbi:hypothetical protein MO973_10480 [Paenibacillus sp. TRM 82003]|nr:hypothetical protein [Paenibacillus sp. TRM 82003]
MKRTITRRAAIAVLLALALATALAGCNKAGEDGEEPTRAEQPGQAAPESSAPTPNPSDAAGTPETPAVPTVPTAPEAPSTTEKPADESSPLPTASTAISLPFALDDESNAKVYAQKVGAPAIVELTPLECTIVLQTLRHTEPTEAEQWQASAGGPQAIVTIVDGEEAYTTTFFYAENKLESYADGPMTMRYAYAYDDQLALMFHALFEPGSAMGKAGKLYDAMLGQIASDQAPVQRETQVDAERLYVEGKDFDVWAKELAAAKPIRETKFYGFAGTLEPMAEYADGILKLNLAVAFTEPGAATPDGVEVGATKEEAREKLGEPNAEAANVWSYKIGDYLRFYLYFEEDAVVAMMHTMPL